jgi:hypothetical protein
MRAWTSAQLAKERLRGFDDHLGHLHIGPIERRDPVVGDETAHLVQLQSALAEQPFKDREDVNDQRGLFLTKDDDAIDLRHDFTGLRGA